MSIRYYVLGLLLCLLAFPEIFWGAEPDNTEVNKRERSEQRLTADEQSWAAPDVELSRKIRRSIIDQDNLSLYAHNVKIITRDGAVTLKGPVRSENERTAVEQIATSIAGAGKVRNQLEVAHPGSEKSWFE